MAGISGTLAAQSLGPAQSGGKPLRIAFLGGSHSHAGGKLKVVQNSPLYELAGMWEPDSDLRARYEKAGVRMLSLDALLGDKSIEVIAVESAVRDHAAHGRLALEAGKHIHLEKPPALDVESFRSLLALAEQKRLVMQMGYMWRYHPGINAALGAAREGRLGEVYLVRGLINTLIEPERRPELAQFRGGQLFELGCHLIDPMVRLLGRPERVIPVLKHHGRHSDHLADNTVAVFEFPGALGVISSATLQPGAGRHRAFEIFGTNGTAVVRPVEPPSLAIDLAEAAGPYKAGPQSVPMPRYERYVDDFVELAAAVRGEKALGVTPAEDLLVQEALVRASGM